MAFLCIHQDLEQSKSVDYRVSTKILREFNFANGQFFVFYGSQFLRLGKTDFSSWELIFAIVKKLPSIWNYNYNYF